MKTLTTTNTKTLKASLLKALETCAVDHEEHGGIILFKNPEYEFVKLTNLNTGTEVATALWTADRDEYCKLIIPKITKEGWKQYASFHIHPAFSANPSIIDLTQLFLGFPINYIYSKRDKQLMEYRYSQDKDGKNWIQTPIPLVLND